MDFYVNVNKSACPKCNSLVIVKQATNHGDVLDCFCGSLDINGNLIRSQCDYEWKETLASKQEIN